MIHLVTRREILLCAVTLRVYAADSEFWNRKDPSEWSADEVDRMITKSPWAKEITVSTQPSGQRGGGPSAGKGGAQFNGLVRWESAKPVLLGNLFILDADR